MRKKLRKTLSISLGFLFFGIGAVGLILPILPTTPFLLLASFFFAKGSKKFNDWFLSTKLYKNHLESFITNKSMTLKTKVRILIPASTMLLLSAYFVNITAFRIFIVVLMAYKYYYFIFHITTIKPASQGKFYTRQTTKANIKKSYHNS